MEEFNAAAVRPQQRRIAQLQQEPGASQASEAEEHAAKSDSHLKGLKRIPDPPNLEAWRQKLFNVDDTIVLTEDQLQTYFPHVDNVYSHRSTQKHKRKGFVSHYWDCRLKGRPPGTPKSDDPNKKKRKRVARERDLCDVKIRITEYPAGGAPPEVIAQASGHPELDAPQPEAYFTHQSSDAPLAQSSQWPQQANGSYGKIFTIQRVNGNGQNGKGDGVPGAHKHTLEYSDSVKKNSVIRWMLQTEKEKKKSQPHAKMADTNKTSSEKKEYHKKATGNALNTVKSHSKECDLKLYGSCFCPFVQRVWISLEVKGIPYQYIEVDPYKKPDLLLQINPRGLVPALRHGDWGCYESTVLMEYLEDLSEGQALLPPQPKTRAHSRLWSDHINRHIIPSFYRFLQEQDPQKQVTLADELKTEIGKIVDVADPNGPFFLGPDISFVDIQMAPWVVRLNRVLKPYRGWPEPEPDSRWGKWVKAIEENEHVRATTSTDELYLDSYERYAGG
ncbi:hypothetical protein H2199_001639 [Coniosporium tulheliwenetii]|uniref:Uncharacterized protein n=1 Tax=Coniosporium tulheliwenetii TaxID=3383036 RepID=A0ACC2ZK64_9PEZI|nr:hypothetical protein H2199_001639 [Cladosporium sp. JES 115]